MRQTNRAIWHVCVAIVLLAFVMANVPARAADASQHLSFLKKLSGTWQGRGVLRRSLVANKEPVSCRLDGVLQGSKLNMAYICLGIDVRFESTGSLIYVPATKRYTGTWHTTGQNWQTRLEGTKTGNRLNLILHGKHPKTARLMESKLVISLRPSGRLVNTVRAVDQKTGKLFEVFAVTFKR